MSMPFGNCDADRVSATSKQLGGHEPRSLDDVQPSVLL